jgi:hypothetical protein
MLAEEFLPVYDVSDEVAAVVAADPPAVWAALFGTGMMRTAATDEHARRWFRRYWTFRVGSGAHILVHALLEMVRETAERAQTATQVQAG